jgi:type I restriction enzyme S subunit
VSDWQTIRLGAACEKIGSGATPRGGSEVYQATGISLIRSQNIYNDGFKRDGLAFIGKTHAEELENVTVQPGDVLLNITGDSVARVCQVPEEILPARVNQHVAIIRPKTNILDARYLHYFLIHPQIQAHMLGLAGAGATRNALTKGMIEGFEIKAPSFSEQRAIASVLGALDDKIELNRRMNETLEALVQSLFKSWFVDDTQSALPKGWRETTLEDAIVIHDSKRIPLSSRERALRRGKYPYHGAASVMDYVDDYLFDGVYTLIGEDGSVVNDDDTPVLQYVWGKFWVNNHAHVLTGKNGVSVEHLLLFLKTVNIRPFVTGAVQPKLNQGNLCRVPFVLPPETVCKEFAGIIEPMFTRIRANIEESRTLAALRDALLPKLLSGELRVPSTNRE